MVNIVPMINCTSVNLRATDFIDLLKNDLDTSCMKAKHKKVKLVLKNCVV